MPSQADTGRRTAADPDHVWAAFLLVPVVALAAVLVAALLLPMFAGAALGAREVDARLRFLGEGFTRIPRFPERSTIYAADGRTVLATLYLDNRELVELRDISKIAREAVISIEDAEFYEHGALDWTAVIRALATNAASGEIVQGGSTITQQLVKRALTRDASETFERKFQELALALRVEQRYSKDEILQLYLNEVYLGNGVYGLGTAADFYFHVPAKRLSLTQGALLAGMLRAPEYYDPIDHPVKARKRRNLVLDRLAELGWVAQEKVDRAKQQPLGLAEDAGRLRLARPPFLVTYLTERILENADGEFDAFGKTENARRRRLYEGGLEITTTLEPAWQEAAAAVAQQPYAVPAANPGYEQRPDTAIVSIETRTGAIRTMLSGRNYQRDQLNLADARRQPGSAFKPFTLVAAFREGIPPGAAFSSRSPLYLPEWSGNDCSCVSNAEGAGDAGYQNLWQATAGSVNVVFAQLILEVGADGVVDAAHDMGIESPLPAVPSLTLGTADVTPIEMAAGYQTLANDGVHCEPYAVAKVSDARGLLYRHEPACKRVIEPEIARLVTGMLRNVVGGGTGSAAALSPWPVAGKTGTTQDYSNAWFVGYTRQVSTAVWVGFPGTPDSLELYFGQGVFGGTLAAPIWRDYMARVMAGMPAVGFPAPPAPETAAVPDLVGVRAGKAEALLLDAVFTPVIEKVDSAMPKGVVVAQTPTAGASVELGSLVTMEVSTGEAPRVKVPDVVGLLVEDARAVFEEAGFVVEVVEEPAGPHLDGTVLAQDPEAGTKLKEGSTVTVTVGAKPGGGPEGG